jgi:cytochrome P450
MLVCSYILNETRRLMKWFLSSGKDRLPGLKDRDNLSYCEATLHEIMRLGTVAPMGVAHSTLCDTQVGK